MKSFDYAVVRSVPEALAMLGQLGPHALPIAGGTDLLVRLKQGAVGPRLLVDIAGIPELQGIALTDEGLRIGSLVTHAEVAASPLVRQHAPAVAAAAAAVGAPQTRNLGTLGGNLVSCVPSLDGAPALMVLEALVTLVSHDGARHMPIEEFFLGPRSSALAPDELLAEIVIPRERLGAAACFCKIGRRKALSLALVNGAAAVELDAARSCVVEARLALGAVAPTPIRARRAEAFLIGKPPQGDVLAEASRIAALEARPIDDFRASAAYRRELIQVVTRRVLEGALSGECSR